MKKALSSLLVFAMVLVMASLSFSAYAEDALSPEDIGFEPGKYTKYTEEVVEIEANGRTVYGTLCLPSEAEGPVPAFVMMHGTGSTRDEAGNGYLMIAPALAEYGIATLRIDSIGCGDSKVDYIEYNFTTASEDAQAAYDYLAGLDAVDSDKICGFGWSQGGTDILYAASLGTDFKAIVLWAGAIYLTPEMGGDVYTAEMRKEAEENGYAWLVFGFRDDAKLSWQMIQDCDNIDMEEAVKKIGCPIYCLNGMDDDCVKPESGEFIAKTLSSNPESSFDLIPGADHTFRLFEDETCTVYKDLCNHTIAWIVNNVK